ncbi:hypothetical protein ABZT26_03150 [Streptomyces sp. NPDC005395]
MRPKARTHWDEERRPAPDSPQPAALTALASITPAGKPARRAS